jgi:hypothetical protein
MRAAAMQRRAQQFTFIAALRYLGNGASPPRSAIFTAALGGNREPAAKLGPTYVSLSFQRASKFAGFADTEIKSKMFEAFWVAPTLERAWREARAEF